MLSKNSEDYCSILFVIQNCILRHCIQSGGKIHALPSKWLSPFYVLYNQGYSRPFSSKLLTVSEQNYVKTGASTLAQFYNALNHFRKFVDVMNCIKSIAEKIHASSHWNKYEYVE